MYVLRESKIEDLDQLLELAKVGITSLPVKREEVAKKIEKSIASFKSSSNHPSDQCYLFALEECETGKVVGTSSISTAGSSVPTFRIVVEPLPSVDIPHPHDSTLLELHEDRDGASELCGLVLAESVQSKGVGHLLSKGRLLYIADHLTRFHTTLFADIRGVISHEGHCIFWEGIGKSFCPQSFADVEELYRTKPNELFPLFPRHPIYLALLSKEVRDVIGVPHEKSEGALQLLLKEGFHITDEIHPLDGGPRVAAPLLGIKTIREGRIAQVVDKEAKNGSRALVARTHGSFRACQTKVEELTGGEIALTEEAKRCLHLHPGEHVRYLIL